MARIAADPGDRGPARFLPRGLDMALMEAQRLVGNGPRERALSEGVESLGDADLVAIVLGTGLMGRPVGLVAAGVLDACGGIEGMARLGPAALADHPGVGDAKALRLAAAIEIGRRAIRRATATREPLCTSAAVASLMSPRLGPLDHEEMWVLSLDGRNGLRGCRRVAHGGLHGCSVAARDLLRAALVDAASALVLVHNHPSGDPSPSIEDVAMTRTVVDAGAAVGVPLVDHVIIGGGRYTSLLDLGIIEAHT
jgi:DNA repair protein RadC